MAGPRLSKPDSISSAGPHECCICQKRGEWDKNWFWYGAIEDNMREVDKCCSEKCRDEYNRKHRIPHSKRGIIAC